MIDRLPYKLTDGVTATHVGLELPRYLEVMVREMGSTLTRGYRHRVNGVGVLGYTYWSSGTDAAERNAVGCGRWGVVGG